MLDHLFDYGTNRISTSYCSQSGPTFSIWIPLTCTLIRRATAYTGDYNLYADEDHGQPFVINHGFSKAHRPDLKQLIQSCCVWTTAYQSTPGAKAGTNQTRLSMANSCITSSRRCGNWDTGAKHRSFVEIKCYYTRTLQLDNCHYTRLKTNGSGPVPGCNNRLLV